MFRPRAAVRFVPYPAMHPLEPHLQAPHQVSISDLLAGTPLACIDGRRREPTIGAPGGSAGLFLVLVHTIERTRGVPLGVPSQEALLGEVARRVGTVYLHSDTHAVNGLVGHFEPGDGDEAPLDAVSALMRPPAGRHEALLGLLVRPEHIGCSHLRSMQKNPAAYGIRPDLLEDFFRAYFRLLWRRNRHIRFEVLAGSHAERAVLHVQADPATPGILWPGLPSAEGRQCFIHHPEAAHALLRKMAELVVETRRLAGMAEEHLVERLMDTYARWLSVTAANVARDLPSWVVHASGNQLRLEPVP